MSEEEIDRLVKEAEENAEADKIARQNIEAKNQLEAYLYQLRSSMQDGLKDKLSDDEKEQLSGVIANGLSWLEEHPAGAKADYDEKKASVEEIANPIIARAYNSNNPSQNRDQNHTDDSGDSPTVEEAE